MSFKGFFIVLGMSISIIAHAEEVVVTPTRYSQSVKDVIPSIIVIDRETIERSQTADIADLLRWHAGLDIGRTGGFGQQTSVFVRGTNSNHTAVLINGIKMNSATTGAAALEMINTSAIERIEIIKGPRSTVYGSEAIGGVINIITTDSSKDSKADIFFSNGRYSSSEQGINLVYKNDYIAGGFTFDRFNTDGFPTTQTSNTDHGHDKDTVNVDLKSTIGSSELFFNYWQVEGNTEYDSFGTDLDQDRDNDVISMVFNVPVSENWQSSLSISRARDEIRQNQVNFLSDEDFAFTDRFVYDWKNDLLLSGHIFTFGASLADEETESLSFGTSYKEDTDIYSVYLHDQLIKDKHSLFSSTRFTDHDDFNDAVTWNLEYGYNIADNAKLFASVGTGFRAPDSNARFGFGGNPDLKEETSRSLEVGLNYNINSSTAFSIRAFENKIEDLIETLLIDPGSFTFENRNIAEARIQGVELSFQHQYKQWDVALEGIIQNPRNESDDSPLLRRAKRTVTSSISYNYDQFFVLLNGLLTSERRDFGDEVLAGYGLVGLSAGFNFPSAIVALKVENLLDKEYELASGFNTPGQSIFAELRIKFAE